MKIYTSYFAKLKELEAEGLFPIGICLYPPAFFKGPNFASVAPTKDILNAIKTGGSIGEYAKQYRERVLSLHKDPNILVKRMEEVSHGKDVALCCFEKPDDFCHRHILADYLNETLGLDVKEYEFPKTTSFSLF